MKELIILKDGEIALKGLNRGKFEGALIRNIRTRLEHAVGKFSYTHSQSVTYIEPLEDGIDMDKAMDCVLKVFGCVGVSRAVSCEKDIEAIKNAAAEYLAPVLDNTGTFKVNAKRSDKTFPLTSPEIAREVGARLLSEHPRLKVDVHEPELTVTVEVRERFAYIHGNQLRGAGGLPTGTSGKACVLISGGIDSPVAAWMTARRGMSLIAVHFASPPYTSVRAEMKVHSLLEKVAKYSGRIELYTVHFTEIQEAVRDNCPEALFTVIMRRLMMRIASEIAERNGCGALVTGESIGQVASQTVAAINCTDEAASKVVFRPLICMDKEDIIETARRIDTFDISVLPYEDCCTVFTPKHPKTRPVLADVIRAEAAVLTDDLVKDAADKADLRIIY